MKKCYHQRRLVVSMNWLKRLTPTEEKEQQLLRQEYLEAFRGGMRNHIEGLKIVDEEGNDVTPDKLKAIQKEKGLHNRGEE